MKKKASNVDGFIVRSPKVNRPTLDKAGKEIRTTVQADIKEDLSVDSNEFTDDLNSSLIELPGYDEIEDSDLIEEPAMSDKKLKKALKKAKKQKNNSKGNKKPLKIFLIILGAIGLIALAVFLVMKYLWPEETIDGNWWEVFQHERLQADENGRSNILIFGTEPEGYDGADLTDSIMLLSINQDDGSAYTVSLPRDLYIKYDSCPNLGLTAGKLNATYVCLVEDDYSNETVAAGALQSKVGEVLGLDVQYFAHLNWAGFEQMIDAVGGVDVVIESSNPNGIYDVNTGLRLANGEVHLDGATALKLARARGSDGGYGLETSNFAREIHQQKIVKALAEKVVSGGVISNPSQALDLLNSLGDNIRTNFKSSEIQSLVDLSDVFSNGSMISLPLLDLEKDIRLVKTDMINGASVVVPTAGTFDYSVIHEYIKKEMSADPVVREKAVIDVLNGSGIVGLASEKAETLSDEGYNIGQVTNAPTGEYEAIEVYQLTEKSATAQSLKDYFGVDIKTTLPFEYNTTADFVIVVGAR